MTRIIVTGLLPIGDTGVAIRLGIETQNLDDGQKRIHLVDIGNSANAEMCIRRVHDLVKKAEPQKPAVIDNIRFVGNHFRDLSRMRIFPFTHQVEGIEALISHPFFALFDEMGAAKTKQVIDAAQFLYALGVIDRVLVLAPNKVLTVWTDPELSELQKHLWFGLPSTVTRFHNRNKSWDWEGGTGGLKWLVSNYEFIRAAARTQQLAPYCTPKTLLVCEESSHLKTHTSQQSKAVMQVRRKTGRVVLLSGTPNPLHPGDLYAQGKIMDPSDPGFLNCKSYFVFRAKYAIMGGWENKVIVGWRDIDDIQRRFAPYVLRRLKKDCLDLPDKLEPVIITAALTPATWKIYKEMRDEMVAWLNESTVSVAQQAIVKAMRLSQITSGFLGGVEGSGIDVANVATEGRPGWLPPSQQTVQATSLPHGPVQEIGREKLDVLLEWVEERLRADPGFKLTLCCRFRPELARTAKELQEKFPQMKVGMIHGSQKDVDRNYALRLLDPRTAEEGPATVLMTNSGSMGLNLTASHTMLHLSRDRNLGDFLQIADRVHRPGQTQPVSYYHILATGPNGQRTYDHVVFQSETAKEDLATFTNSAWVKKLLEE